MMYFLSNPSVYTLPGTWEAQPYVDFDPTYLILSATTIFAIAAVVSILSIKQKRKRV